MRIAVTYVFPNLNIPVYEPLAKRFVESYINNPPGLSDHETYVLVNGGKISERQHNLFHPLPVKVVQCTNYGKDIGAFQTAAGQIECDLLVCLGSHIHFHKPGWLDRIAWSYMENGPALYGAWGFHMPTSHIRTTAFWIPPELFLAYPRAVSDSYRYQFESGRDSLTSEVLKWGYDCLQVTWDNVLPVKEWRHLGNDECLMLDQHTDRMGYK